MATTIKDSETGFIVGRVTDPTYWKPESFTARYEQTANETRQTLEIERHAREDGVKRYPAAGSTEWGDTERLIRERCQAALTSEIDSLTKEIDDYKGQITDFSGLANKMETDKFFDNNVEALAGSVNTQMSADSGGIGAELIGALKDRETTQREYNAFRVEHRRHERATYPRSVFWHVFVIVLILISEGLANSYFFGQGNDLGLLGGFLEALLFAAINVGLALMVAFSLRRTNSVYAAKRATGWAGVVLFSALMVFVACVAALYRLQAANAPESAELSLLALPWGDIGKAVASKDGILLILLAVILGIVAVMDWFMMDDAYPYYGAKQRALDEVKTWIVNRQAKATDSMHQGFLRKMREVEIPGREEKLKKVLTRARNIERVTRDYENAIVGQLESAFHRLLKEYRDINVQVRSTETNERAPVHFSEYPRLLSGNFDAPAFAKQATAWVEKFDAALGYFQTRKQQVTSENYSLTLMSVVVQNFDSALTGLVGRAKTDDEYERSLT